jgi:NADPH-dependent 2,4-dienoyl-CoA reductase/sulfur reductase-like enzyme
MQIWRSTPASFFDENNIRVLTAKPVRKIDPKNKILVFEGGDEAYDALVLATGARAKDCRHRLGLAWAEFIH